jgi:hypothetical protein
MSSSGVRLMGLLITLLTFEKLVQHLATAVLFVFDVPGVGRPDIGPFFRFAPWALALLNVFLSGLFLFGLLSRWRKLRWAPFFIIELAALDIVLEALFHGLFFITVSVVVSTLLILVIVLYQREYHGRVVLH